MSIADTHINIKQILTKEQKAYDEALKNMRHITARLKISQEGIDTNNISQEKLDIAIKLFDEMEIIQRDFNIEAQKVQQDTNNKMRLLQEDGNKKFGDAQSRYRELINSMRGTIKDRKEDDTENANIVISKEREEEIKSSLAAELARSQGEKAE